MVAPLCAGGVEGQTGAGAAAAAASGPAGREALLSRLVEQLKGRLQSLREENQQLEDMLHQSDARASGVVDAMCHQADNTLAYS